MASRPAYLSGEDSFRIAAESAPEQVCQWVDDWRNLWTLDVCNDRPDERRVEPFIICSSRLAAVADLHEINAAPLRTFIRELGEACAFGRNPSMSGAAHDVVNLVEAWAKTQIILAAAPKPDTAAGGAAESKVRPATSGPDRPAGKGKSPHEWLANAMLLVRDHPDWSDAAIAKSVGRNKSQLSRSPEYQAAATLARGSRTDRPHGYVKADPESGLRDVEAVTKTAAQPDDQSDRGKRIAGSKYVREYCAECGESMKVTPDKVGTKPVCKDCQPT